MQNGSDVYGFDRTKIAIRAVMSKQKEINRRIKLGLLRLEDRLPYKDNFFDPVIIIRALYQAKMAKIKRDL